MRQRSGTTREEWRLGLCLHGVLLPAMSGFPEAAFHPRPLQSFVGGWNVPYGRLRLSQTIVGFPFGRLDIFEDRIVFRARGALGLLIPQRVVPLTAVQEVSSKGSLDLMSRVRVKHRDGVVNWVAFGQESEEWLLKTAHRG
jgi:hypothetical protein